jgi:hypothetical protein
LVFKLFGGLQGIILAFALQKYLYLNIEIIYYMADTVDIKELYELAGYVKGMSDRSEGLNKSVTSMEAHFAEMDGHIKKVTRTSIAERAELKDDIQTLKNGVKDVQKILIMMIAQMKNTLKRDDFDRFEKRIDMWAPEALVNRREVNRVLKNI